MVIIDENDVGKPREEVLMDLIYEETGNRIPLDKVNFGKPKEVDQRPDLKFDSNTFIPARINPQYDTRFAAPGCGFMYRRRPIAQHCAECDPFVVMPAVLPFKVWDVLGQINEYLPYPIGQDDVINTEYTELAELTNGLLLKAHPESLLWCGSSPITIDPRLLNGVPLITNLRLDGFREWVDPGQ